MKSFIPQNLPSSGTAHVSTQQHCSVTKLTQKLAFQSQQSLHHQSLTNFESNFLEPIEPSPTAVWPSASSRLAKRWEDYMGMRDWAGLLDPLDETLRDEILRYGSFIEATYRAFDFDPESPSHGSSKYQKRSFFEDCGIPNSGFRLTRHLRATSGIQLPGWAHSSWAPAQSSWIGFVAVCNDRAMIDQLGRREVVIALRGTATCLEWLENLRATLAPVPGPPMSNNYNAGPWDQDSPPMVESGFLSLYTSGTDMWPSLQDAIRLEVSRILELYKDEALSITITGHSLGAALATLAAYDIKITFEQAPLVTVISFGGPRVGNQSFRSLVDKQGTKILRVVNPSDLITKVPGFVTDDNDEYVNINKSSQKIGRTDRNNNNNKSKNNRNSNHLNKIKTSSLSFSKKMHPLAEFFQRWIQQFGMDDTQWWVYAEVGRELRLENKESEELPHYLHNMNVAKCHDLKTYLNLVEDCPMKAYVKRSLRKLARGCNHNKNEESVFA